MTDDAYLSFVFDIFVCVFLGTALSFMNVLQVSSKTSGGLWSICGSLRDPFKVPGPCYKEVLFHYGGLRPLLLETGHLSCVAFFMHSLRMVLACVFHGAVVDYVLLAPSSR